MSREFTWFATKDTISKKYDHRFKDIFNEVFESEYKEKFEQAGIAMNNRDKWEQEQESRRFYEDDPEEHEQEEQ